MKMERITADPALSVSRAVYVIDDEIGIRLSVTDVLEDMGYDVWSFAGGADLLEALPGMEAGCLMLDIQMPGLNGMDVMEELARQACHWPVIVMTAHGDVPKAVRAMKLGAVEFIEKPFTAAGLQPALERAFAQWDERSLRCEARRHARNQLQVLSAREHDVLIALSRGKQNKVAAHDLGLSVRTVEMHRANLLGKLGVRTPQEAVALLICARDDFAVHPADA